MTEREREMELRQVATRYCGDCGCAITAMPGEKKATFSRQLYCIECRIKYIHAGQQHLAPPIGSNVLPGPRKPIILLGTKDETFGEAMHKVARALRNDGQGERALEWLEHARQINNYRALLEAARAYANPL